MELEKSRKCQRETEKTFRRLSVGLEKVRKSRDHGRKGAVGFPGRQQSEKIKVKQCVEEKGKFVTRNGKYGRWHQVDHEKKQKRRRNKGGRMRKWSSVGHS